VLRDNGAAIVLGSRTIGAGCGDSWGGTPTRLATNGAALTIPDCVRYRADGSNEVRGILPDVAIAWRTTDGRPFPPACSRPCLPGRSSRHARSTRRSAGVAAPGTDCAARRIGLPSSLPRGTWRTRLRGGLVTATR